MLPGGSGNGLSTSAVYSSEKDFFGDIAGFVGDFNAAMRLILRGKTTSVDAAMISRLYLSTVCETNEISWWFFFRC